MGNKLLYINILTYFSLIIINILAIQIPFFGKTPGEVSDLFPNLLTPANFTFKIWSLLYLLLGFFILDQVKVLIRKNTELPSEVSAIGVLFLISSVLNFSWLISWQSQHIAWSFILIFTLWLVLISIYYNLAKLEQSKWVYTIPFSAYLAWVSITSLANLNVLLIELKFNFFGLSEEYWTTSLIVIGIFGTFLILYLNKDIWFTMVLIWAFFGIYMKNILISDEGNWITFMSLFAIFVLSFTGILVGLKNWNKTRKSKLES